MAKTTMSLTRNAERTPPTAIVSASSHSGRLAWLAIQVAAAS